MTKKMAEFLNNRIEVIERNVKIAEQVGEDLKKTRADLFMSNVKRVCLETDRKIKGKI